MAPNSDGHAAWKKPVRAFFRRDGAAWKLVGFERMPDKPAAAAAPRKSND